MSHPAFAGAAQTLAQIFDLQHQARDVCLMPDPETGEPINVSHMIPRSRADLERRHACLQTIAEFTVGLMGRTPDYMNVTFAGFAGRADEWAVNGNERGAANLVAYQKFLARKDISLTHTIVHPTIDKAKGDVPEPGNDVALHKVADTAHGIVVRGARILATLAPFADEIAVYPAMPLPEGTDAYALSFCIPMDTPGLKFLCRDSCATAPNHFDHPLSSRFDEQDAFVIFDDVEVPRDRVFIDANRRRLQHRDDDRLVSEHHAADDDPGADQARVRLRAGDPDGRSDQRRFAGDASRCSARSGPTRSSPAPRYAARRSRRSNTATACGFPTAVRSRRCAPRCRPGFRASARSSR